MKSEYRNVADVKVKEIVTLINVTVDDKENEWKNDVIDNNWEKWTCKTDTRKKCASSMFTDIALFVDSQYIKTSKQIWWTKLKKFWKINLELKTAVSLEATTSLIDFETILKLKTIL